MSTYVLSLTPDDADGPGVIAHLEIADGELRVVELTVRPGRAGTPLPAELPGLDFRLLAEQAAVMSTGLMPLPAPAPEPENGRRPPSAEGADGRDESRPGRSAARRDNRAVPRPDPAVKGVPSDLGKVYWRLGSVAKVADHYDVPRQIARGWVKSLRTGGALPDPWSGSGRRRGQTAGTARDGA